MTTIPAAESAAALGSDDQRHAAVLVALLDSLGAELSGRAADPLLVQLGRNELGAAVGLTGRALRSLAADEPQRAGRDLRQAANRIREAGQWLESASPAFALGVLPTKAAVTVGGLLNYAQNRADAIWPATTPLAQAAHLCLKSVRHLAMAVYRAGEGDAKRAAEWLALAAPVADRVAELLGTVG